MNRPGCGKNFCCPHLILSAFLIGLCGCQSPRQDLWQSLDNAARPASGLQQTQFALIGAIVTPEGRFHVAQQRLVTKGALSPRGQAHLLLFDRHGRLVKSYWIRDAFPLWCEESRIYLGGFGSFWDIPLDPRIVAEEDQLQGGNVVDFSRGIQSPFVTREMKYGSSGGIEHDPWRTSPAAQNATNDNRRISIAEVNTVRLEVAQLPNLQNGIHLDVRDFAARNRQKTEISCDLYEINEDGKVAKSPFMSVTLKQAASDSDHYSGTVASRGEFEHGNKVQVVYKSHGLPLPISTWYACYYH